MLTVFDVFGFFVVYDVCCICCCLIDYEFFIFSWISFMNVCEDDTKMIKKLGKKMKKRKFF